MTKVLSVPWKQGVHFGFTGIDGSGKSTQAGHLAFYMKKRFGPTYLAEPRTDMISQLLHSLAWHHGKVGRRKYYGNRMVDFAKSFDVVRDYQTTLVPLLSAGTHVVEPRSVFCRSAMAFAMNGERDIKTEEVLGLIPKPDLLFWLDTKPDIALERINRRAIDCETLRDLQLFYDAYHKIPESRNWIHIDGNAEELAIAEQIRKHVDAFFASQDS